MGVAYSFDTASLAEGTDPLTFSAMTSLPAGLTYSSALTLDSSALTLHPSALTLDSSGLTLALQPSVLTLQLLALALQSPLSPPLSLSISPV